jgi:hypothetical protein
MGSEDWITIFGLLLWLATLTLPFMSGVLFVVFLIALCGTGPRWPDDRQRSA